MRHKPVEAVKVAALKLLRITFLMIKNKLFLLPLVAASLLPIPALSQATKPAATTPVTTEQLETYIQMAAVVSCTLMVEQKVPFAKAIPPAAAMVTNVLAYKHGGLFQSNPKQEAIPPKQLFENSFVFIVRADKTVCYSQISSEDQKEVDKFLDAVKNAQSQPQSK